MHSGSIKVSAQWCKDSLDKDGYDSLLILHNAIKNIWIFMPLGLELKHIWMRMIHEKIVQHRFPISSILYSTNDKAEDA